MKMRFFLFSLGSVLFILLLFPGEDNEIVEKTLKKEKKKSSLVASVKGRKEAKKSSFIEDKSFFLKKESSAWETFQERSRKHFEKKQQAFSSDPLIAEGVLFDPEFLEFSKKSLGDLEWLFKSVPKNQAYVRIFALDLIKERATREGPLFLTEFICELFDSWEKNKIYSGAGEDLMELVMTWVECRGKNEVFETPELLFSALRYEKKYKKIFSRALANLYPNVVPNSPKTREIIKLLEEMG